MLTKIALNVRLYAWYLYLSRHVFNSVPFKIGMAILAVVLVVFLLLTVKQGEMKVDEKEKNKWDDEV